MAVTVRHGVNQLTLNTLARKTVAEVRSEVSSLLNVPASAQVRINSAINGRALGLNYAAGCSSFKM